MSIGLNKDIIRHRREDADVTAAAITDMITTNEKLYMTAKERGDKEAIVQHGSAILTLRSLSDRLEFLLPHYYSMDAEKAKKLMFQKQRGE